MLRTKIFRLILGQISFEKRENGLRVILGLLGIGETSLIREVSCFSNLLRADEGPAVVLDIGANVGDWSVLFYKLNPDATLHLFEPQKILHQRLKNAIKVGGLKNAVIHNYAISGRSGSLQLFSPVPGSGAASVVQEKDLGPIFIEKVQTRTLTDILADISDVRGIKIDTEGMEWEILSSAKDALRKSQVEVVQFEFGEKTALLGQSFKMFFELFSDLDFSLFRLTPIEIVQIKEYSRLCEIHINTVYFALKN